MPKQRTARICGPEEEVRKLPVFGSVAWVNVHKDDRTKFDYKAKLGVWVGVPKNHGRRSNKIYMLDTKTIVVSRHVEIWDGVMYSQLRQTEFDKSLPSGPVTTEGEKDDGIPVIVTFKKNGQRNMREFDTGTQRRKRRKKM